MKVTHKNILFLQNLQTVIANLNLSGEDYVVVSRINKLLKKLAKHIEDFQESVEDLKLDNCYKEKNKIVRENGQLQWTVEGEKAFRKAYKELLLEEVEIDADPINFQDLYNVLPKEAQQNNQWEDVEEVFTPFFVNQ